jgi:hypothetical protein
MPATLTTTALDSSGLGRRLIAGSKGPPLVSLVAPQPVLLSVCSRLTQWMSVNHPSGA